MDKEFQPKQFYFGMCKRLKQTFVVEAVNFLKHTSPLVINNNTSSGISSLCDLGHDTHIHIIKPGKSH